MNNKKVIVTILTLSCLISFLSITNSSFASAEDWSTFHKDTARTSYLNTNGPTTNQTIWNYTTTYTVGCSPCVADGVVYISSNDGNLYAFADTAATVTPATASTGWIYYAVAVVVALLVVIAAVLAIKHKKLSCEYQLFFLDITFFCFYL